MVTMLTDDQLRALADALGALATEVALVRQRQLAIASVVLAEHERSDRAQALRALLEGELAPSMELERKVGTLRDGIWLATGRTAPPPHAQAPTR